MARRRRRPSTGDGGQLANGSRPAIISLWWWLSRCCQTGFGYVFCCCCCSCCVTGKWASFNQVGWYHARQGGRKSSVSVGQRDKRDSSRVQTIASRVDRQERDRLFKGRKTSWNWCTFIKWKRKEKRRKTLITTDDENDDSDYTFSHPIPPSTFRREPKKGVASILIALNSQLVLLVVVVAIEWKPFKTHITVGEQK